MKGLLITMFATAVAAALLLTVREFAKDSGIYEYCDLWFLDCEHCNKVNNCSKNRKEGIYD